MATMDPFKAAQQADPKAIKAYLSAGGSILVGDPEYGAFPIHWACLRSRLETVKLLLEVGGAKTLEARTFTEGTPLVWACMGGDGDDAKDISRSSRSRNNRGVVDYLLWAGANHAATTKGGGTALHHAASYGHPGAVASLLQAGADCFALDCRGDGPGDYFDESVGTSTKAHIIGMIEEAQQEQQATRDWLRGRGPVPVLPGGKKGGVPEMTGERGGGSSSTLSSLASSSSSAPAAVSTAGDGQEQTQQQQGRRRTFGQGTAGTDAADGLLASLSLSGRNPFNPVRASNPFVVPEGGDRAGSPSSSLGSSVESVVGSSMRGGAGGGRLCGRSGPDGGTSVCTTPPASVTPDNSSECSPQPGPKLAERMKAVDTEQEGGLPAAKEQEPGHGVDLGNMWKASEEQDEATRQALHSVREKDEAIAALQADREGALDKLFSHWGSSEAALRHLVQGMATRCEMLQSELSARNRQVAHLKERLAVFEARTDEEEGEEGEEEALPWLGDAGGGACGEARKGARGEPDDCPSKSWQRSEGGLWPLQDTDDPRGDVEGCGEDVPQQEGQLQRQHAGSGQERQQEGQDQGKHTGSGLESLPMFYQMLAKSR